MCTAKAIIKLIQREWIALCAKIYSTCPNIHGGPISKINTGIAETCLIIIFFINLLAFPCSNIH